MKHLYIALYYDANDDKDVYWFTGDDTKGNENDLFVKSYNEENGELDEGIGYDEIVSVYQVADREILEIAESLKGGE